MKRVVLFVVVSLLLAACGSPQSEAQQQAQDKAKQHDVFVPQNDIEFKNYNQRQLIADDPTTLLWCTTAFPFTGSPMITVPIVGKVTSGNKRPYFTSVAQSGSGYTEELPGPDGMYGQSSDYRYGFTPGGVYVDFTDMPLYCSTEPSVWQRESTELVLHRDSALFEAQQRAREALAAGNTEEARRILQEAISQAGGH